MSEYSFKTRARNALWVTSSTILIFLRFILTGVYDLPWFSRSVNIFKPTLLALDDGHRSSGTPTECPKNTTWYSKSLKLPQQRHYHSLLIKLKYFQYLNNYVSSTFAMKR